MGSRLSTLDKGDAAGPLQNVAFFQTIRAKWMEYFISKLNENILSDLDISNSNEMLQWKDYFNIFAEIRGFVERDNDIKQRLHWHPATSGFMLQKELPQVPERPRTPPEEGLPDDYTEDEASDVSDSDEDSMVNDQNEEGCEGGKKEGSDDASDGGDNDDGKGGSSGDEESDEADDEEDSKRERSGSDIERNNDKPSAHSPPPHWNPEHMSPIFYGYSDLTVKVFNENIKGAREEILRSEERAVQKALSSRVEGLAEYEAGIRSKEKKRQEKIDKLVAAYVEARNKREETMSKEKIIMPPVGFRVYKVHIYTVCVLECGTVTRHSSPSLCIY